MAPETIELQYGLGIDSTLQSQSVTLSFELLESSECCQNRSVWLTIITFLQTSVAMRFQNCFRAVPRQVKKVL